ncbi:hypothetical protein [Pseudomonas aeruginosa]|uniref:hypothetical protein n=1 Tax=Pseudomonas aeruginosa TaxID=287 RepID=UPI000CE65F0D|nr:hypothetical protein [Pseudomonas aeruginosa]AVE33978.1 hypothetical protein HV91_18045 [Pseudomonas aeruginosa]ELB6601418.1 hypothetical protein [Pseudomonas aeruginosa]ELH7228468.1 hypothetical protein [Pseudomonas aeruginosa]ELT7042613.1 hypothetical protein [Pseudomonas aeruginosa]MBV6094105.1 hypothetical protein [Pseudomonas aeruginosa]
MRKHTPGPWQWNHGRLLHNFAGEYSETILDIEEEAWRPTDDDAKLIAGAPELLEALQVCIEQITALCSADDVPDQARAAIAKATA